ncbi:hypothetical protein RM553_05180 [Zunongwangia sp. F363]|uniref:Class IIb bacteriocin, lactobin A/cerein 7B family n=1 Tax=Autumnicola tepida TaxID=3075595 RepID=A0ABU3C799_9FLAO|nr:hypothetical protein [Zunongwangia sp. F363]MDT0642221.1 hypothetical protein [Zunongwangia sp. F363]
MRNLVGVEELSYIETKEIEGGAIGILTIIGAASAIIAVGAAIDYAAEQALHGWNNPR